MAECPAAGGGNVVAYGDEVVPFRESACQNVHLRRKRCRRSLHGCSFAACPVAAWFSLQRRERSALQYAPLYLIKAAQSLNTSARNGGALW